MSIQILCKYLNVHLNLNSRRTTLTEVVGGERRVGRRQVESTVRMVDEVGRWKLLRSSNSTVAYINGEQ